MRTRIIILAALGAVFTFAAVAPALADRDGWRRHEWRERGGYGHHQRHGGYYGRPYYAGPPVVYVPQRAVPYYYAPPSHYYAPPPPPVYFGPPSVNFGFSFR